MKKSHKDINKIEKYFIKYTSCFGKISRKVKRSFKNTMLFICFQAAVLFITAPILVYYGPFEHLKSIVVQSTTTSLNHQWISKMFLSEKEIREIMDRTHGKIKVHKILINPVNKEVIEKNKNDGIELFEVKGKKFGGLALIIKDPTRIKVGCTKKLNNKGEPTSSIAMENNALAAINGGGFIGGANNIAWTSTGGTPKDVVMSKGTLVYNDIKNENEKIDVMAMTEDGVLIVGTYTLKELKKIKVSEIICFGPALIINGAKHSLGQYGGWGIAPRTAIGQRTDGAIILLIIEGRKLNSIGATLEDVQKVLYEMGAVNATNLDGGYSTTMYYGGKIINKPFNILGERAVPSIVYVEKR